MINDLTVLLLSQFAAVYPVIIWLVPVSVIKRGFVRFNLGLATIMLGLATLLTSLQSPAMPMKGWMLGLGGVSLVVLGLGWHRMRIAQAILTPLLLLWGGLLCMQALDGRIAQADWAHWMAVILGGAVLAAVMYAMVLGHWYLNVAELPIGYLRQATRLALLLLAGRAAWIAGVLAVTQAELGLRLQPAYLLLTRLDGFILWIGLLMGLAAPLVFAWMAMRTARIQSTQSATGLLYVVLILVVMGTLIFDGYLLELELPL